MSYLLDSNTCAALIRNNQPTTTRASQHLGSLHASVISVTELEVWLLRRRTPLRYQHHFFGIMRMVKLIDVNEPIAHRAAVLASRFGHQGLRVGVADLLIAATALEHGLTLVSRGMPSARHIPGLTVLDWSIP